jgi:hypothetical protein
VNCTLKKVCFLVVSANYNVLTLTDTSHLQLSGREMTSGINNCQSPRDSMNICSKQGKSFVCIMSLVFLSSTDSGGGARRLPYEAGASPLHRSALHACVQYKT